MEALKIPRKLAEEMVRHAREEAPNECCGILAGKNGAVTRAYRTTNMDHSPVKYSVDPKDIIRVSHQADEAGLEVLAFYHSHTFSEAYPSVTDVNRAAPSDLWGYQYVIISLASPENPVLRSFHIAGKKVHETKLELTE